MLNLSVIIADDDRLVLKDLQNMVSWNKLGFTIAATASSGEEAFRYIEKYQPFLLITDIRMLGDMNGLDLIEQAHKKYPHMKFLVISSYDDFHYLKRAMASGVIDYLLKTDITPATLTKKLQEAKSQRSRDNKSNSFLIGPEIEHFIDYNWQPGENQPLPTLEQFPELDALKNNRYYFILASRSHYFSRNINATLREWGTQTGQILEDVYQLSLNYDVFPIVCQYNHMLLIGLSSDMTSQFAMRDFSNSLLYLFGGSTPLLQFCLKRAMTLTEFRDFILPTLRLIYYHQIFFPEKNRSVDLDSLSKFCYIPVNRAFPFHALVLDNDHLEDNILLLKSYMETCFRSYDITALEQFYYSFCAHLEIRTNNQIRLPETLFVKTPEDFQKWIYNRLEDCILLLNRGMDHEFSSHVESAIRFMQQNYSNPEISSAEIAEASGLSVNRLGILFKQDTGKTINEYLAHIRIEKAIELLEKTNLKIYEVSDRCGYKSSQYFSQVFFQKTGRKPLDYRKGRK